MISLENRDARTVPSSRWMKTTSVLLIVLPLILMALYQSWIQLEAGLLAGCELEDLSLVVILLLSQKPYLRTCRTYAKTSACNMCRQNVNDSLSSALSVKIISVSGYFGDDMFNDYMQL